MKNGREKIDCLILIPARGGSKGISEKNMALLGGKPLVEFTIEAAINAKLPGRICLSTDDQKIRDFALSFPIEAPFLRPAELAQDDSDSLSVINHALDWYDGNYCFSPEFLVLLQPTCPLRNSETVIDAYKSIIATKAKTLMTVNPVKEHPCKLIMRGKRGYKFVLKPPRNPQRQNFPEVLAINGAIHIARVSHLKKTGNLYDNATQLYIMNRLESTDIDEPDDLEYANWIYENKITE